MFHKRREYRGIRSVVVHQRYIEIILFLSLSRFFPHSQPRLASRHRLFIAVSPPSRRSPAIPTSIFAILGGHPMIFVSSGRIIFVGGSSRRKQWNTSGDKTIVDQRTVHPPVHRGSRRGNLESSGGGRIIAARPFYFRAGRGKEARRISLSSPDLPATQHV